MDLSLNYIGASWACDNRWVTRGNGLVMHSWRTAITPGTFGGRERERKREARRCSVLITVVRFTSIPSFFGGVCYSGLLFIFHFSLQRWSAWVSVYACLIYWLIHVMVCFFFCIIIIIIFVIQSLFSLWHSLYSNWNGKVYVASFTWLPFLSIFGTGGYFFSLATLTGKRWGVNPLMS